MSEGGSGKFSRHLTVTQETDDFGISSPPKSINYEKNLSENTPTDVSEVTTTPNTTSVHNNQPSPTQMSNIAQKSPRYLASGIPDTPPIPLKTPVYLTEDIIEEGYDMIEELGPFFDVVENENNIDLEKETLPTANQHGSVLAPEQSNEGKETLDNHAGTL